MVTLDAVTCQANILQVKRPILVDMVLYVEVDFINTSSHWTLVILAIGKSYHTINNLIFQQAVVC